jgi:hypothetical protein
VISVICLQQKKKTDASISDLIFFHILLTAVLAFHVIDVFSLSWNRNLGKSTGGNFSVLLVRATSKQRKMRTEQYGLSLTIKIGPPIKNEKPRGPSKSNHKANSCEWKDQYSCEWKDQSFPAK